MFVLAVVFADTHPASAHEMYTTTAQQARETGTMEAMRDFVLHVKEHREQLRNYDDHAEFRNVMRTDDGTWKSGNTYIIAVNSGEFGGRTKAGEVISFHAQHPGATDKSLRNIKIFEELMIKLEGAGGEAVCVEDPSENHGNHICAVETTITNQFGVRNTLISVAGFHHELGEEGDHKVVCPDFGPQYFREPGTDSNGESFTRVSAGMLDMAADRETLVNYVKTVDEHITEQIKQVTESPQYAELEGSPTRQGGLITTRLVQLRPCWRQEPWRSESIYFVMFRHAAGKRYSVFNGLNPALKDSTLIAYDGCVDVDQLVVQKSGEQDEDDRFVEYYWSNPVKDDDVVLDEDGNPIPGLSPGTSLKVSYVLPTNFGGAIRANFVIVSGIYPEDRKRYVPESGMCHPIPDNLSAFARDQLHRYPGPAKDDGGCAIASGDQGNMKIAGFNLFLLTVVLFSAIWGKSRSGGKFWTSKL